MNETSGIEVRPAGRPDADRLAEFFNRPCAGPGAADPSSAAAALPLRRVDATAAFQPSAITDYVLAARAGTIVGACRFVTGAGRCAVVPPPRLETWDEALAARLLRAAAARVHGRDGARLIQTLVEPQGAQALAAALERAGFERLAVLAYLRRPVRPEEQNLALPPGIKWRRYWRLRHQQFARTIAATYGSSLDCPALAGLRSVDDAITTHKATGLFCPRAWHLLLVGGEPAGVVLLNNLQGRGEVVYLGVVPAARRRDIGQALVTRAIRDTAAMGLPQMGLAVDVSNAPAMRLYEKTGFSEIRRRLAYFIPASRLAELVEP
jgi:ribosomal protein S18 acetylase RimI-like enzyme